MNLQIGVFLRRASKSPVRESSYLELSCDHTQELIRVAMTLKPRSGGLYWWKERLACHETSWASMTITVATIGRCPSAIADYHLLTFIRIT